MNRRGFLGAIVAFACSPAFPAPALTYKGVPLVFDDYIPYKASELQEMMEELWQKIADANAAAGDCKWTS